MSANRSVWDPKEKLLLREIYSDMPRAKLKQVSQEFNSKNHQHRTEHAIKAKLQDLGLKLKRGHDGGTTSASSEERTSIPSRVFEMRYAWSVPELGIFIPLHPLIAEARRHASRTLTPGYAGGVYEASKWPSELAGADISGVRCEEADRMALRNYLNYLKDEARARTERGLSAVKYTTSSDLVL